MPEKRSKKKTYRKPRLKVYGGLGELTQMPPTGSKGGSRNDPGGMAKTRV